MSVLQDEEAHDLTLVTIESPFQSGEHELASATSPLLSPESEFSLNDLSHQSTRNARDQTSYDADESCSETKTPARLGPKIRANADRDAKRMETKLQRNLKQQQGHYARQRKLFEDLSAERALSQSECSPISESSRHLSELRSPSEGSCPIKLSSKYVAGRAATFRLHTQNVTSSARQKCASVHSTYTRSQASPTEDENDEDDSSAQDMLRRIKEKARADFHRQRLPSADSPTSANCSDGRKLKAPAHFLDDLQQQEVSSDALRRQLELLRRLQVENNRFRQESRVLRERNNVLKERDQIREREAKRLREDVAELNARVQKDHTRLATTVQTEHKLKVTQKNFAAAQSENRDLQAALREVRDAHAQLQSESQTEIAEMVAELKRWKRNTKQLRQQGDRTDEEVEFYKKTIVSLEDEAVKRRSQLKDAKREMAELTAAIAEKASQCEQVEISASECVGRVEEGMERLQKSLAQEQEKRKKVESVCSNLQTQLEQQHEENALLLEKQSELEQQLAQLKENWKERKHAHQEHLRRNAVQLEEFATRHKNDASALGSLRQEYETLEARLVEMEISTKGLKDEIGDEARAVQMRVECLRKYVEHALRVQPSSSNVDDTTLAVFERDVPGNSDRPGIWRDFPELQVVQGAISALRNEMMDMVHEFQRARHLVRQQGNKLALSQERAAELEHLRAEDAAKMKDLREQRKLAEQARDIVSQEKTQVLKWSEQTCQKNEVLEAELKKCVSHADRLSQQLCQALEDGPAGSTSYEREFADTDSKRSFAELERFIDELVSVRDHWRLQCEKYASEVEDGHLQVQLVEKDLADKADEFKQTLENVEHIHAKNVKEQKLHFEQCITDLENERNALATNLEEDYAHVAEVEEHNVQLQQQVAGFEQDVPVFATILHLFVLVVQPLILQVSDLLAQKRFLLRENAEFAVAQHQFESIGQVLKEMVPTAKPNLDKAKEKRRQHLFRRVVIAVFAINRLHHFANRSANISEPSAYGLCTPLKSAKTRRRTHGFSSPQPTVIKLLPPKATLSRLSLRPVLERLKKLQVTQRVADAMDSSSTASEMMPTSLGSLIMKVVMAIDPESKEMLVANTNGTFHCEPLLERRRKPSRRGDRCDPMTEYESDPAAAEDDIPTVALIRKRILALGKRVEDLHYQRNALQKENYEFQFQLEQQAQNLSEMETLQSKAEALQEEMTAQRCQTDQELQRIHEEHDAKHKEIQAKEDELSAAQKKIEGLEENIATLRSEVTRAESNRVALQHEVDTLKSVSIEEEEKADKSKAAARRQEDEVRSLKQAVKKAHELYQKVSWQLEQEVQEKSTLKTVVEHLKRQHEKAQRERRDEKIKELENSFNDESSADNGDSADEHAVEARKGRDALLDRHSRNNASPLAQQKKKTAFVAPLDADITYGHFDDSRASNRRCENPNSAMTKRGNPSSPTTATSLQQDRGRSSKSRRSNDADTFRSEWQRVDMSTALLDDDISPKRRGTGAHSGSSSNHFSIASLPKSPGSPFQTDRHTQTPKSRRRMEIDKVNAAVHDYMDRIDDKLSKMYGIPPSSAIQRPTGPTDKQICQKDSSRAATSKWNEDWDVSSDCSSLKDDEIRRQ